jgi:sodium-dependent dicarboxylate transporter 2/3/5
MSTATTEPVRLDTPEARPRRRSQHLGVFVGLTGFFLLLLVPTGLTGPQQRLTAVLFLAVVFWMTEAMPLAVTSLLAIGLAATMGIANPDKGSPASVVFSTFSSSVIFLLIGGFLFAKAIHIHGLDRRFALAVLSIPGVAKSSYRVIVAFGAVALFISAFVSNSATAAMLLPIGLGLITTLNPLMGIDGDVEDAKPKGSTFGVAIMLMIAYGAAVGGLLTPIGSPANLVGIGSIEKLAGHSIGFLEWMTATAPIVLVMFVILCIVIVALNRPEQRTLPDVEFLREQRKELGPMTRGEKSTLLAFGIVCSAWLIPSIVALSTGTDSALSEAISRYLDDGATAIIAATLLFLLPGTQPGTRVLTWEQAVRIDWGVIMLIGAGVVLGGLLSTTGLAKLAGENLSEQLGTPSLFVIALLAAALAIGTSELTSNTAAVAVVVPIVIPISIAAGVDPVIPAIAAVFGGSFGFMLPISQPPNAIVYGTGLVPLRRMLRTGIVFDIVGCLLITIGVTVWVPILGIV